MKIVNLTPHTVRVLEIICGTNAVMEFPSEGCARVETTAISGGDILAETELTKYPVLPIPTQHISMGSVTGLPEPEEGTLYIVSLIVLSHPSVFGRTDVVAPATGPNDHALRFKDGPNKGQIEFVTRHDWRS